MKLDDYLDAQRDNAFDWQERNCCHFAAGWVALAEGSCDLAEFTMPSDYEAVGYSVEPWGTLASAITQKLQRDPVPGALAQYGDVVQIDLPAGRHAVGIGLGRRVVVLSERGLAFVPASMASLAWRVRWSEK